MATNTRAGNGTPLRNTGSETPRRDQAKKVTAAAATPAAASPRKAKANPQQEEDDITMLTSKLGATNLSDTRGAGGTTFKKPQLKLWEQDIIQSNAEVKRKATIAQLCQYRIPLNRLPLWLNI